MTYSDAKNCFFSPMIGSRLPDAYKKLINSIPDYSRAKSNLTNKSNFNHYV